MAQKGMIMKMKKNESDFAKKIKRRAALGAVYAVIGVLIIAAANVIKTDNETAYSFGAIFAAMGIAKIVQNMRILRNPSALRTREMAENDERNVMIVTRARSLAFSLSLVMGGMAVPVLFLTGNNFAASAVAYTVCGFAAVYWVSYLFVRHSC